MSSLPTISSLEQLLPTLKIWQQALNPVVSTPPSPRAPFNFSAAGGTSGVGITLSWEPVSGADGYQIQASTTGDFSTAPIIATLSSPAATSWFDNTATTAVKKYYKIRATSGTTSQPQSVFSAWTAPINATSGSGTTTHSSSSGSGGSGLAGSNPGIGGRGRTFF